MHSPTRKTGSVKPTDPKLFYTGLVAQLYGALKSTSSDPEPYARFIGLSGEPALELGCGEGEPLLDLRARGFDVEGLDSSSDMLERCRQFAADRDIDVVLHLAAIEEMDLGRQYATIYLAGATFNLLPTDEVAAAALERIHAHLRPGGSALVPLFVPAPTPADRLGQRREHITDAGIVMGVTVVGEERDDDARRQTAVLRYEMTEGEFVAVEERPWLLHWHTQEGFRALARAAGLTVNAVLAPNGDLAMEDDDQFTFWLTRPRH